MLIMQLASILWGVMSVFVILVSLEMDSTAQVLFKSAAFFFQFKETFVL